jgi:sn-glycerol 3-phosphate transport system ATP-binding protein
MTLADRLVVMNAGRIEQLGAPNELYERPESLFVAGFIGTPPMNLFDVKFLAEKAGGGLSGVPSGTDVVGVRPDMISLEPLSEPAVTLSARLELIEPVGGESHLHMRIDGTDQLIVLVAKGRPVTEPDVSLPIYLPVAAFHCFEKATGRRVN